MTRENDERPEYLVSGPQMKSDSVLDNSDEENGEFIDFEIETQAVFKRLADDIYESNSAGIREPLTNAITAVLQARDRFGLENPQVEITVEGSKNPKLTIRDNGIGIRSEILEKVLSVIGRSMNRAVGEVSGKYGMGFLACYKLVGTNGGFIMHTRSRRTDEAISGVWRPGGFDKDENLDKFDNPFEETDTYGTQLEFFVKDEIENTDIRSWVRKNSEWARVPVIYREFNEDGEELLNEDYGEASLSEQQWDGTVLKIENDHFVAYASEGASGNTLLLDTPIKRNYNVFTDLPWDIDVRLKNENGVIFKGDNKGLEPIEREEYKKLTEKQKQDKIPKDRVKEDDICIPSPIGTRDSLERKPEFWDYIAKTFEEKYISEIANIFEKNNITDDIEPFVELNYKEKKFVMDALEEGLISRAPNKISKVITKNMENSVLKKDLAEELNELTNNLIVINRDEYNYTKGLNYKEKNRVPKWKILSGEGQVFMTCKPTPDKIKVVFKDNDENTVVKLNSADYYEKYEEKFGWRRLTYIKSSTIDEFNIPEELRNKFKKNKSSSKGKLTLYYKDSKGTRDSSQFKVEELVEKLNNGEYNKFNKIIAFPRSDRRNVSDNKWLANHRIGICSCTNKQWDTLKGTDRVVRAKDYIKNAMEKTVVTSRGNFKVDELTWDSQNVAVHILKPSIVDFFKQEKVIEECERYINEEISDFREKSLFNDCIYIPLTVAEMDKLRPVISSSHDGEILTIGNINYDLVRKVSCHQQNNMDIYAKSRLYNWKDEEIMSFFESTNVDSEKFIELVETLAILHDAGKKPANIEL